MGMTRLSLQVANVGTGDFRDAGLALVDTGSEVTWVSAELLRDLGVNVEKRRQFLMANGDTIARDVGYARVRCGEFETVDEVVFAQDDDLTLIGARTLEGFNAIVDPVTKQLVAAGPIIAA